MRRRPPRRRVGRRDELGRHLTCCAECSVVQDGKIFVDRAACRSQRQTGGTFKAVAVAGVGLDQTGVDGKAFAADQPLVDAAFQDGFEQAPQQIALAKAAVPVLREGQWLGTQPSSPSWQRWSRRATGPSENLLVG